MANKILFVDDESRQRSTMRGYFENAGFQVIIASTGQEAVYANRQETPDLIVMDIMMPEMDGWEATRLIRQESRVPIIMLTARVEDVDKIVALEMGVDDYVTKPFNPRELLARVRAVLRRTLSSEEAPPGILRHHNFELNLDTHETLLDNKPLDLTPSEFGLLAMFLERPGRVFTRMEILEQLQGEAFAGYQRTVDVHIKNLRAKIEPDPKNPEHVETVYGVGYRMSKNV